MLQLVSTWGDIGITGATVEEKAVEKACCNNVFKNERSRSGYNVMKYFDMHVITGRFQCSKATGRDSECCLFSPCGKMEKNSNSVAARRTSLTHGSER